MFKRKTIEPENIRAFNYVVLFVFERLYKCFPDKADFNGLDELVKLICDSGDSEEAKFIGKLQPTILWLEAENFTRVTDARGDKFRGVVLTHKGLTALQKTPGSLGPKETLGIKIRSFFEGGAKDARGAIVSALVTMLLSSAG